MLMLGLKRLRVAIVTVVTVLIPLLGTQVAFAVTPAPTLTSPASNATVGPSIAVSFNLPVAPAANSVKLIFTGSSTYAITLTTNTSGSTSFTLNNANLLSNAQVGSVVPLVSSVPDGAYTVTLSYQDAGLDPPATASSTNVTIDTAAPILTSSTPASGQTAVSVSSPLTIVLNKAVSKGSGSIVIRKVADSSVFESIAVGTGQVTLGSQITITPSSQFDYGTTYSVSVPAGAFVGFFNSVPNGAFSWQFTTAQSAVQTTTGDGGTTAQLTDTGTRLENVELMACGLIAFALLIYFFPSRRHQTNQTL